MRFDKIAKAVHDSNHMDELYAFDLACWNLIRNLCVDERKEIVKQFSISESCSEILKNSTINHLESLSSGIILSFKYNVPDEELLSSLEKQKKHSNCFSDYAIQSRIEFRYWSLIKEIAEKYGENYTSIAFGFDTITINRIKNATILQIIKISNELKSFFSLRFNSNIIPFILDNHEIHSNNYKLLKTAQILSNFIKDYENKLISQAVKIEKEEIKKNPHNLLIGRELFEEDFLKSNYNRNIEKTIKFLYILGASKEVIYIITRMHQKLYERVKGEILKEKYHEIEKTPQVRKIRTSRKSMAIATISMLLYRCFSCNPSKIHEEIDVKSLILSFRVSRMLMKENDINLNSITFNEMWFLARALRKFDNNASFGYSKKTETYNYYVDGDQTYKKHSDWFLPCKRHLDIAKKKIDSMVGGQ